MLNQRGIKTSNANQISHPNQKPVYVNPSKQFTFNKLLLIKYCSYYMYSFLIHRKWPSIIWVCVNMNKKHTINLTNTTTATLNIKTEPRNRLCVVSRYKYVCLHKGYSSRMKDRPCRNCFLNTDCSSYIHVYLYMCLDWYLFPFSVYFLIIILSTAQ